MVRFIDLEKGDTLYEINLKNKRLEVLEIIETPYINDFDCCKELILPITSYYLNKKCSYIKINLDKIKQSICFEDTYSFIFISDKKVLKYFINLRD